MKPLLLSLAALSVALFASMAFRAFRRQRHEEGEWPFAAQKPLSQVEQGLYFKLVHTLPDQVVLSQVPLVSFLRVRKGTRWYEWYARISEQSVDFLVCDRDFGIVAAIELDDRAGDGRGRAGDATKNRALAAARIPLVRWHVTALPDATTIRAVVDEIRRDRFGDVGLLTPAQVEASLIASRIDASNDPTMFHEETRQ